MPAIPMIGDAKAGTTVSWIQHGVADSQDEIFNLLLQIELSLIIYIFQSH